MAGNTAYKISIDEDSSDLFFENQIAPEYVTTKIAARLLGVTENALRIKVNRKQIRAYKLGRSLRFKTSDIQGLFLRKD